MGASLAVTPKARAAAAGRVGSAALTEQMAKTAEWEAEAMSPEAVTCGKLAAAEVEMTGPTVEARAVEGGAA